jgi:hypothetical protein
LHGCPQILVRNQPATPDSGVQGLLPRVQSQLTLRGWDWLIQDKSGLGPETALAVESASVVERLLVRFLLRRLVQSQVLFLRVLIIGVEKFSG